MTVKSEPRRKSLESMALVRCCVTSARVAVELSVTETKAVTPILPLKKFMTDERQYPGRLVYACCSCMTTTAGREKANKNQNNFEKLAKKTLTGLAFEPETSG